MGLFSKKLNSNEYEELVKRIASLEAEIPKLTTLMHSLRGIINRKIGFEDLEDPENSKKTKDIKEGVLLPNEHGLA